MPEMPKQSGPAEPTVPKKNQYEFEHVSSSFARELVGDLSGLGESFDKGEVNQWEFLQFCVKHLTKIDNYIASKSA